MKTLLLFTALSLNPMLVSAEEQVNHATKETKDYRTASSFTVLGNYSLIDTWVPSKFGVSFAYIQDVDATWELEYLRGSISMKLFISELGKITDERFSLLRRFYSEQNSFNYMIGATMHAFTIHLGDRLTALATSNRVPSFDLVNTKTLGVTAGIGNRWQLDGGWTLGVDWFSLFIPIVTLEESAPYLGTNANDAGKNDVNDVIKIIKHIPTFAIFKFQVGISF